MDFKPGVTFRRETVQITGNGDLGLCTSTTYPNIAGGTVRILGAGAGSCAGPFVLGYGRAEVSWNDGSQTVINGTRLIVDAQSFSVEGGSVASGPFIPGTLSGGGRPTKDVVEMGVACVGGGLTNYPARID